MGLQFEHGTINVRPMKKLMLPTRQFETVDEAKERLQDLQYIINKNNDNIERALFSTNRLLDFSIDNEGCFKHQLAKKHFKKDAIDGPSMEKSLKNFVTDIMFRITVGPGPLFLNRLEWAQNGTPPQPSIIYWPDYGYTNLIAAGSAGLITTAMTYAYVKPRDSDYSPLTTTSAPPASIRSFLANGRVVLGQAKSGRATGAVGWRHVNYGGGLHLKV